MVPSPVRRPTNYRRQYLDGPWSLAFPAILTASKQQLIFIFSSGPQMHPSGAADAPYVPFFIAPAADMPPPYFRAFVP